MDLSALPDPRHQRLLEWEMTPVASREPSSQAKLAEELGVSPRTLRDWKESPKFQAAWRDAFRDVAGSMERTKTLLDVLYADATNPANDKRVASAKLYFDIMKQIAPPEPEVQASRRAQELSDDELRDMISAQAAIELEARFERVTA